MSEELFNTLQVVFSLGPTIFLMSALFFTKGDRAVKIMRARLTLVWLTIFCGVQIILYLAHATLFLKIVSAVIMGIVWAIIIIIVGGIYSIVGDIIP